MTLGPSCRTLLTSLSLGLAHYVDYCINTKKCSKYFIGGFRRLGLKELAAVGLAATSSFASDATLLTTLADDRLVRQLPQVDFAAEDMLTYVFGLPHELWAFAGEVCGLLGPELRRASLHASMVSMCYFNWRIHAFRQPPYSFCHWGLDAHNEKL